MSLAWQRSCVLAASLFLRSIGTWGELATLLSQVRADGIDSKTLASHMVDGVTNQHWQGSSSQSKRMESCFNISLATSAVTGISLQILDLRKFTIIRSVALSGIRLDL